jgi:arsenite methyltransferase
VTADASAPLPVAPDIVKACCAASYSSDLVSLLLGDSYHPGGLRLTRRLLDVLQVEPGERLVDVASGPGTTALLAAAEYDADVDGVDLSPANVRLARGSAAARDIGPRVRFHDGDAEALPLADESADRVVCECALCTFPDKTTAVREMARVLRSGGRLGITDITADRDRLPAELTTLAARVACVADARTAAEYQQLLEGEGLSILALERHDHALERMIRQIEARLELLRMTARARAEGLGVDFAQVRPALDAARAAVRDGILGYVLIAAEKP